MTEARDIALGDSITSVSVSGSPSAPVSGTRQFGYSVSVPGWFTARRSPTRSGTATPSSRDGVRSRKACRASTIVWVSGSAPAEPSGEQAALAEHRQHSVDRHPLGRLLLRHGAGEQPETLADRDVLQLEEARSRWQVVRRHRSQAEIPILLRRQRAGIVVLEPEDRRSQHAALTQVVAHPRLDDAEVFADHHRTGTVCLQRQHADHRLGVVVHVRALGGQVAGGDPPEPEEPHHVVDAHAAGVTEQRAEHVSIRRISQLGKGIRAPRRLVPVLPELVELIRRGTHRDRSGKRVTERPGVRTVGVHTDSEVVHHAETHPGGQRLVLGHGQLVAELPLQPAVEVHLVGPAAGRTRRPPPTADRGAVPASPARAIR